MVLCQCQQGIVASPRTEFPAEIVGAVLKFLGRAPLPRVGVYPVKGDIGIYRVGIGARVRTVDGADSLLVYHQRPQFFHILSRQDGTPINGGEDGSDARHYLGYTV